MVATAGAMSVGEIVTGDTGANDTDEVLAVRDDGTAGLDDKSGADDWDIVSTNVCTAGVGREEDIKGETGETTLIFACGEEGMHEAVDGIGATEEAGVLVITKGAGAGAEGTGGVETIVAGVVSEVLVGTLFNRGAGGGTNAGATDGETTSKIEEGGVTGVTEVTVSVVKT